MGVFDVMAATCTHLEAAVASTLTYVPSLLLMQCGVVCCWALTHTQEQDVVAKLDKKCCVNPLHHDKVQIEQVGGLPMSCCCRHVVAYPLQDSCHKIPDVAVEHESVLH